MNNYYKNIELKDVISEVIDYRGKTPKKLGSDWSDDGYRALSAKNIKNGNIIQKENIRFVDEKLYFKWMKKEIQRGDILITSEAPFGEVLYWDSDEKIVLSQRIFGIRCKDDFFSKYIYYFMNSHIFQHELTSRATGTTVTGLRQPELLKCNIKIFDYDTQRKIANTLTKIDEKIRVCSDLNHNLEEQLQSIFKAWFFNFEPFKNGKFIESEMGLIPKGFRVVNLGDIVTRIKDRVKQRDLKVLSAVKTGNLQLSEEYFTKQVFSKNIEKYVIVDEKNFAYNPARVNIGSIGRNDLNFAACVSPVYIVFQSDENYNNFIEMFIKTSKFKQEVIVRSSGSVRQNLSFEDFSLIRLVYPPENIVIKFNNVYNNLFEVIEHNTKEIEKLSKIRDIILPKLMSGEIDVSNVEI
ncbi:restriction endonuclease subunit S [Methanobrevibacter arboriphilus]|uniref:restriction endonuclease subunit S n=1 Tax=Methanobrevibacter arboriphilus TaxID=39441 RepID=UPI0009DFE333|nr:restriction endonuclease subunit S [Methanobrevibacter arboriphilus]